MTDIDELAEQVVAIAKSHPKEPTAPLVAARLKDALAEEYERGRTDALNEVTIWLDPVLDAAEARGARLAAEQS